MSIRRTWNGSTGSNGRREGGPEANNQEGGEVLFAGRLLFVLQKLILLMLRRGHHKYVSSVCL